MKKQHIFYFLMILGGIGLYYWKFHHKTPESPFLTTFLEKRTIKHVVHATGVLELKDTVRVGSLVSGTITTIEVTEQQKVKKGDLLATIDNGKGDTEVKEARAELKRISIIEQYQKRRLMRAQNLFASKSISAQDLETIEQAYETSKAEQELAAAVLEKKEREYANLNIYAPIDGMIVGMGITEGMRITTDLNATVLFYIARNLSIMHGILEIDESDIADIKKEQKVTLQIESHPYKTFKGKIIEVRYSPHDKGGVRFYQATVEIDNTEDSLRPGMTLQARIHIAKEKNQPTLPSTVFTLNKDKLVTPAQNCKKILFALSEEEKRHIQKKYKNQHVQFVWILHNECCKETPVILGITDDLYYCVLEGIEDQDAIICSIKSSTRKKQSLFS